MLTVILYIAMVVLQHDAPWFAYVLIAIFDLIILNSIEKRAGK